jgi:hypothetical protein
LLENQLPSEARIDGVLLAPYYRKIRKHPDLAHDIRAYDRMPVGDPNRTLKWLRSQVDNVLRAQRLNNNLDERDQQLRETTDAKPKRRDGAPAEAAPAKASAPQPKAIPTGGGNPGGGKGPQSAAPLAPAPAGKDRTDAPKGKGAGKGPKGGKGDDHGKGHCRFYHQGTCNRGSACPYLHDDKLPSAEKAKLRAMSPKGGNKGRKGAGKGSSGESKGVYPCYAWLETGTCPKGDACHFAHLSQEEHARLNVPGRPAPKAASAGKAAAIAVAMPAAMDGPGGGIVRNVHYAPGTIYPERATRPEAGAEQPRLAGTRCMPAKLLVPQC